MHFEQLDDDVLSRILRIIVLDSTENMNEWKANIPLLHVNRRWRALARPLTHKNVLIEAIEGNIHIQPKLASNLSFVCKDYAHKYIRSLKIALDSTMDTDLFYKSVCSALAKYSDKLSTTSAIILSTFPWITSEEIKPQDIEKVYQVAKRVAQIMPKVTKLSFYASELCALADHIYGMLTSVYSQQLSQLMIHKRLMMSQPCCLTKLTRLDISLDDCRRVNSLLRISTEYLVQLTLHDAPSHISWDLFRQSSKETGPQNIGFVRLRKLNIIFAPDSENRISSPSESSYMMHFPQLEELELNNLPVNSAFLKRCDFPNNQNRVTISATLSSLASMMDSESMLPKMDEFSLFVDSDNPEEPNHNSEEYESSIINGFIKKYHGSKKTFLHLNSATKFRGDSHIAKASNLSTIYLHEWNDIISVIKVVETVPDLTCLVLDVMPEVEMFGLDTDDIVEKLEPLNTNISSLALYASWHSETTLVIFLVVLRYMILRIPTLTKVYADDFSLDNIDAFILNHMEMYPHLTNIHFITRKHS